MLDRIDQLMAEIHHSMKKQQELEYEVLEAQINPHFIYNTLNGIRSIAILQNHNTIAKAIEALISLLQSSIRIGQNFVSIEEELKQVKNYVELQLIRYLDSFKVIYDVSRDVLRYKTVKFLLQSVVENAIFHGIEGSKTFGVIKISIHKQGENIIYEIWDNGAGMDEKELNDLLLNLKDDKKSRGYNKVGLKNIDQRIRMYFGKEYGISVTSKKGVNTTVRIVIPAIEFMPEKEEKVVL